MQASADAPRGVNQPLPVAAAPDDAEPAASKGAASPGSAVLAPTAITPQAFLGDTVAQLASLLTVGACAILLDEDGPEPVAAIGLPEGYLPAIDATELPRGFRSYWSIPLRLPDGPVLGHFLAFSRDREGPDERTLELASAFGSVIALALDRLTRQWGLAARYQAVVVALSSALDTRDEYSGTRLTGASSLAIRV